jgi:hypothetical protein
MKYFASLFFFLSLFLSVQAQEQKEPVAADNPNAPEITFETMIHDYGTIDYAADGTYAFKFTNTGNDPLVISNCAGSCGCTVPKCPKEAILKGQSGYINVSYDTKRPGPFTKTVTVQSNAKNGTKVLTIKGVVRTQEQTDDQMPLRRDNTLSPMEMQSK